MLNERELPARWYELLRERMHVEQQRMALIKNRNTENNGWEELMTRANSLDQEMTLVMRQAIDEVIFAAERRPGSSSK
jgi:hypothetical protein